MKIAIILNFVGIMSGFLGLYLLEEQTVKYKMFYEMLGVGLIIAGFTAISIAGGLAGGGK